MGGNAFARTTRLTKSDYTRIQAVLTQVLSSLSAVVVAPPELRDKTSFGDIDLCACIPQERLVGALEALTTSLSCPEPPIICEHKWTLLSAERFQIDLALLENPDMLPMHLAAKANGDLCMLLQMSLGRVGLLLTQHGFFIKHPRTLLSTNPVQICAFLRLPDRAFDGCSSLTKAEMFEAVASCRFFDPAAYAEWAQRDTCRTRKVMAKRPLVTQFLLWAAVLPPARQKQEQNAAVDLALEHFAAREAFEAEQARVAREEVRQGLRRACKALLGGHRLKEWWPEMNGQQVGGTLRALQDEMFGGDLSAYHAWLAATPQGEVKGVAFKFAQRSAGPSGGLGMMDARSLH